MCRILPSAAVSVLLLVAPIASRAMAAQAPPKDTASAQTEPHHLNVRPEDAKWDRIFPELGDRSAEIAILRVDSMTHATQLMIRVPKNFHVPQHWHSANETHTILSGTFVIECEGKRQALGAGSFNYIPRKMAHEAWTKADEGALLFVTVDAGWDVNWVKGPPKPADLIGGLPPGTPQ